LGFANVEGGTQVTEYEIYKVGRYETAGVSERVRLVSDRIFKGQTGIKNRTGSAAVSIALARFVERGGIGPVLVRIVLRLGGL